MTSPHVSIYLDRLQTLAEVSSFFAYSNTVESGTPSSDGRFRTDLRGDFSLEKVTAAHVTIRGIGRPLRRKYFKLPYEKGVPPIIIELHCAMMASKIDAKTPSPVDSSSYLCAVFHAPKHSLPDVPQRNNSSCRSLSASHNTQLVM